MRSFTTNILRAFRKANYKAAGGIGKEPPNSKRRTLASNHIALHQNFDLLGHTGSAQSMEYTGGVTKQQAAEFSQIVPC